MPLIMPLQANSGSDGLGASEPGAQPAVTGLGLATLFVAGFTGAVRKT
jgi:hypothetical protein